MDAVPGLRVIQFLQLLITWDVIAVKSTCVTGITLLEADDLDSILSLSAKLLKSPAVEAVMMLFQMTLPQCSLLVEILVLGLQFSATNDNRSSA